MLRPKKRIWLRRFLTRVRRLEYVVYIHAKRERVMIGFKGGLRRTYTLGKYGRARNRFVLHPDSARAERIRIGYEYQDIALKDYPLVHKSRLKQATDIEKDLLIFELAHRVVTTGCLIPLITRADIVAELKRVQEYNPFSNGTYTSYCTRRRRPGDEIIWGLCDVYDLPGRRGPISQVFKSVKACAISLNRVIHKSKASVTIKELLIGASRMGFGPKFVVPGFYAKLFADLLKDCTGVYDYSPGLGTKMIAAHLRGMSYDTLPDEERRYDRLRDCLSVPKGEPDTCIIDSNFTDRFDYSQLIEALDRFRQVLVYVPRAISEDVKRIRVPQRVIRVKVNPQREYDFMFLYRSGEKR